MITLISASNKGLDNILIDSALNKLSFVDEIIILHQADEENIIDEGLIKRVYTRVQADPSWVYAHPLLLHRGIELARNDLLLFCDDDIFFLSDITAIYLEYINKYGLDMVGVTHYAPSDQAFHYFPTVINMLVYKYKLPYSDWLKEKIQLRRWITTELDWDKEWPPAPGKWLLAGAIPGFEDRYPNPKGTFDVGCNLWLWAQMRNIKYAAFGPSSANRHIHQETNLHSCCQIQALGARDLIYHRTNLNPPDGSWPKLEDYIERYRNYVSNGTI